MSDQENTEMSTKNKQTPTFNSHFSSFNDKMPIKEKLKNLCLLEQNNYFIGEPLNSLDHVDANIRPIKAVPSNFRSLNKWKCLMNQKLNFVWKNMDAPFCEQFKTQLEEFKSIDKAYGEATKINRDHNPEYKSNKSTSIGLKERKKIEQTQSTATASSSTSLISCSSSTAIDQKALYENILTSFKDEARLEILEHFSELEAITKMSKQELTKKYNEKDSSDSQEFVNCVLSENLKKPTKETLILWNFLSVFHSIVHNITVTKVDGKND
jgi:hypothetical protein